MNDIGKLILRLSIGILMLFHGVNKITNGISGVSSLLEQQGLWGHLAYGVYIGEVLAPIMLIIGFQVRIAAGLIVFTMLVAIYAVFGFSIFGINEVGALAIESQMLYLLPCVALLVMGGGKYGISFTR